MTPALIRELPFTVKGERSEYTDARTRGLSLRIYADRKVWTFSFMIGGKDGKAGVRRKITLGDFPTLSLDGARKRASALHNEVLNKVDPAQAIQARAIFTETLGTAFQRYLETHCAQHFKASTLTERRRLYARAIRPTFGKMRLADIGKETVRAWHASSGADHPREANIALNSLAAFLSWCVETGLLPFDHASPCVGVRRNKEKSRDRLLSEDENARLWTAINALPAASAIARDVILTLMLTGARRSEIMKLRWSEVDLERKFILIADAKTGKRIIQLPPPALLILESQRSPHDDHGRGVVRRLNRPIAFSGTTTGGTAGAASISKGSTSGSMLSKRTESHAEAAGAPARVRASSMSTPSPPSILTRS